VTIFNGFVQYKKDQ